MDLKLFPLLSTCSRRAMLKTTKKWGHPYKYKPRGTLLQRLSKQTGLSIEEVYIQLMTERQELLKSL